MIEKILREFSSAHGITITDEMIEKFKVYFNLLVEWNEKMNLTAITEEREVAVKHFCDSLYFLKYVNPKEGAKIIDIGTGAGFPGIPLKIVRPDIKPCLMDSLNKRLVFLKEVCTQLSLEDVEIIHSRAEDGVKIQGMRESFDYATSRAVAQMNTLCEYCLAYVKVGGSFVPLKANVSQELENSRRAIGILGGKIDKINEFTLEDSVRTIIEVKKIKNTPPKYPRNSGQIKSKPL